MKSHYNISARGAAGGSMSLFGHIDIVTLMLYVALVLVGWLSITSASVTGQRI